MQTASNDLWYLYILPFVVPAITALVVLVKKQTTSDSKSVLTDYNFNLVRVDITEIKTDIKEVRREQQELKDNVNAISSLNIRVGKLEDTFIDHDRRLWPQVNDALRQLDVLRIRVDDLQDKLATETQFRKNKGAVQ